jgi:hypothetical protein
MTNGHIRVVPMEVVLRQLRPDAHVRVFVAGHDRFGGALQPGWLTNDVEKNLTTIAGGSTTISGRGNWLNGANIVLREPVEIVEAYLPSVLNNGDRDRIKRTLTRLAISGNQEAVAIALNGDLFIVRDFRR